jgi:hypothetical protein
VLLVDLRAEGRVLAGDPLAADALAPDARFVVSCRALGSELVELRARHGAWARGTLPELSALLGAGAEEGDASEVVLRVPATDADARLDALLGTLDAG